MKSEDSSNNSTTRKNAVNPFVSGLESGIEVTLSEGEVLLNRFVIERKLGAGGFGSVYCALDRERGYDVALKVVITGVDQVHTAEQQIRQELRLRDSIKDFTHIIMTYDIHPVEYYKGFSLVLLSMEYANGQDLRSWLEDHQNEDVRISEGLKLFKQACCGVEAIHQAGLVHLDLKPENLLLCRDGDETIVKVSDFGISRNVAHFAMNVSDVIKEGLANPYYMSPEQFDSPRQKDIGHASDIYSLGIVLFEILDGNLPFDGAPSELRDKHLNRQPPRLAGALEKWQEVVDHCLAKKAEGRYGHIEQLIQDIDRLGQENGSGFDVSCPQCGHITEDKEAEDCEECHESLHSRFRPCPTCARPARLDVEICPGCGEDMAAYNLLQQRKEQIEKLKNTDPEKAIELLETVLSGNAREYRGQAIQLVRDLRKKQTQITVMITKAGDATAFGAIEEAIEAWENVRKIIPHHHVALDRIVKLKSLLNDITAKSQQAARHLDEAKFDKAEKILHSCLKRIPTRKQLKDQLDSCRQRKQAYTTTFDRALSAVKQRQLREAEEHLRIALTKAEKSHDALSLQKDICQTKYRVDQLCEQAHIHLKQADFIKVDEIIREIEQLQADQEGVTLLKPELRRIRNSFSQIMRDTNLAVDAKDLTKAGQNLEKAFSLCPDSKEASHLSQHIEELKSTARNHLEEAEEFCNAAAFDSAKDLLRQARDIWPKVEGSNEIEEKITSTEPQYQAQISDAQTALKEERFADALSACQQAEGLCPQAEEVRILKGKIKDAEAEKQAFERREQAERENRKKRIKRWAKVIGIFVATVVIFFLCVGWSNQRCLLIANNRLLNNDFDEARNALAKCGWFWSWGKADLTRDLDTRQAKSLVEMAEASAQGNDYSGAIGHLEHAKEFIGNTPQIEMRIRELAGLKKMQEKQRLSSMKQAYRKLLVAQDITRLKAYGGKTWLEASAAFEQASSLEKDPERAIAGYENATNLLTRAVEIAKRNYLAAVQTERQNAALAEISRTLTQAKVAWPKHEIKAIDWKTRKETLVAVVSRHGNTTTKLVAEQILTGDEKPHLEAMQLNWSPDGQYLGVCYRSKSDTHTILLNSDDYSVRELSPANRIQWVTPSFLFLHRKRDFQHQGSGNPFTDEGREILSYDIVGEQEQELEDLRCSYYDSVLISPGGKMVAKLCSGRTSVSPGIPDYLKPGSYFEWYKTDQLNGCPAVLKLDILDGRAHFSSTAGLCNGIVYPCKDRSGFSVSGRLIALPIYQTIGKVAENGGRYGDSVHQLKEIRIWEREDNRWKNVKDIDASNLPNHPTSIETILWNRAEDAILIGCSNTQKGRIKQWITYIGLENGEARCVIWGRDPQWLDGASSFIYGVPGATVTQIDEIRAHDIETGADTSLIRVTGSTPHIAAWVRGEDARIATLSERKRLATEDSVRQRLAKARQTYLMKHPAHLEVQFYVTISRAAPYGRAFFRLNNGEWITKKIPDDRPINLGKTKSRVKVFEGDVIAGNHKIDVWNAHGDDMKFDIDLEADQRYVLRITMGSGYARHRLAKE